MGWLTRGALGLLLMLGGVAGFVFGLYELVKTGTCASGGPYVSARQCPASTPYYIGGLIAGVFVFLAGGALFATRGRPATDPGLPPPKDSLTANPRPFGSFNND
jgi:uncharacterized membrane protein